MYLAPDPAVASALQTATAEYETLALPDEVVTVLRGCATDIERDLDRLIHAATTGDPGGEVHIIDRDEMDGINSLDQRGASISGTPVRLNLWQRLGADGLQRGAGIVRWAYAVRRSRCNASALASD
ncbi:MAG: hypothetical protein R3F65_16590 [bacterium]